MAFKNLKELSLKNQIILSLRDLLMKVMVGFALGIL